MKNVILMLAEESESADSSVRLHMTSVIQLDKMHCKILRFAQDDTMWGCRTKKRDSPLSIIYTFANCWITSSMDVPLSRAFRIISAGVSRRAMRS